MFDIKSDLFDEDRLQAKLSRMSDDDLAALEDDLDFCNFTGVPSARLLDVLKDLTVLDKGWQRLLDRNASPEVPTAY